MKFTVGRSLIITFFSLCFMGFQCEKDIIADEVKHEYNEKLTLFPYRKSYNIGDTIWIQYQTASKVLFDRITNRSVSNDTTALSLYFQYRKHYPVQFSAVDTFCYTVSPRGVNQELISRPEDNSANELPYQTECSETFYRVKAGFIPKKTGIYSLIRPGAGLLDCPGKITYEYVRIFFTFDLADCNKDIYLSIPPASRGESVKNYTNDQIDRKEIFFFRVE